MKKKFQKIADTLGYRLEVGRYGCYTHYIFVRGGIRFQVHKVERKGHRAMELYANEVFENPTRFQVYKFSHVMCGDWICCLADGNEFANLSVEEIENVLKVNQ